MKRLFKLCIVLSVIAMISAPVFAEVQNVKVSGDVNSAAVYRNNYDLMPAERNSDGLRACSSYSQSGSDNGNFLYTQARIRVDADLTDNVMATIRYLTEYDWCTSSNTAGDGVTVDLDLANVTIKEEFYQPLTVTVGRQELKYGNAFVVGDPDTNTTSLDGNLTAGDMSLRKSFDAIRAVLDYSPTTVDIIFAKIDESSTNKNDEDLYGVNIAYDFSNYDAEAEGYWFVNRDDSETAPTSAADAFTPGHEIHTFGIRGSMVPVDNLNIFGEYAIQRGDYDKTSTVKRDQDAYAYQIGADYTLQDAIWGPVLRACWTHYSGEGVDNAGDQEAWLPMYEDQTHGVLANYILGGINGGQNSNADILNLGANATPAEDLAISLDLYWFWLDKKLVSSANTALSTSGATNWYNIDENHTYYMNSDDDLGFEIDVAMNYDYTEDVKMGLSAGWFLPGNAFEGTSSSYTNDETATQIMATLDVVF